MVQRYGMDIGLGPVAYGEQSSPFLEPAQNRASRPAGAASKQTAQEIDDAMRGLLKDALERATQLLRTRRMTLDRCVQALLAKETLEESELLALVGNAAATDLTAVALSSSVPALAAKAA